jgi:toluene monooxygenase system protein E
MRQLQGRDADFGAESKQQWQATVAWQPLRRVIETLLVTHDFGQAFVTLNLLLKPAFDRVFLGGLGEVAEAYGDALFSKLLFSLGEDAAWHHAWARALLAHVLESDGANRTAVKAWVEHWMPHVESALSSAARLIHTRGRMPLVVEQTLHELHSLDFFGNTSEAVA